MKCCAVSRINKTGNGTGNRTGNGTGNGTGNRTENGTGKQYWKSGLSMIGKVTDQN